MFWKSIFKSKKVPTSKIDYDYYFSAKTQGDIKLSVLDLGKLVVTSGKLIACDPLVCLGETKPFARTIERGTYPVKIAVASNTSMGERYALAKLEISARPTVRWELALTADGMGKLKELAVNEYIGFPVDAGLGCFCDLETQSKYSEFMDKFIAEHPGANMYDDYFSEKFKANATRQDDPNDIGDWVNYTVPDFNGNIIMFHSGFGDGLYPTYWGFDENNQVTSLLIDFQILGEE